MAIFVGLIVILSLLSLYDCAPGNKTAVVQELNFGHVDGPVVGNGAIGRRNLNKTDELLKTSFQTGFMVTNFQGPVIQNQNKDDINHTVVGSGFAIGKRKVIQGQNWGNIGGGGGQTPSFVPSAPAPPAQRFGSIQGQNWGAINGPVSGSNFAIGKRQTIQGQNWGAINGPINGNNFAIGKRQVIQGQNWGAINAPVNGNGFAIGKRQVIQGQNWGNIGGGGSGPMPSVPNPMPVPSVPAPSVIQGQNWGAINGPVSGSNFAIGKRQTIQGQNWGNIAGGVSGSNFAIGKRQVIQGQNWGNIGGGSSGGTPPFVPGVPAPPTPSFGSIQGQNWGTLNGPISGTNFAIGRRGAKEPIIQTQNFGGQLITQVINDD